MARTLRTRIYMLDMTIHYMHGQPWTVVLWFTNKPDTKQLIDAVRKLLAERGIVAEKITARLVPVNVDIVIAEDTT